MLKKSSVWLIVLAIFLWILPLSTAAESTADGLEYEVTGDGVTVTKYTGSAAQVTVPASIDGKPVTAIGDQAFFMCADLTSVTLPEGLKRIGLNAFLSSGLTSVVVPDSVTDMGEGVFDGCRALTSAVLPAGLKEIPARTFQMCEALTSFTIPSGVTSIGFAAFEGCRALPNIRIPNGVETVDTWAFSGCELITSVYLPDSVRYLGEWVFSGSVALASVRIPDGVETILGSILSSTAYYNNESNWNGCALYAGRHLVDVKYDAAGAYTILPGTLTVCDYAFNQRQELTSLSVPDSVRYIGPEAFTECSKLTDIYFAGSEAQWNAAFAGNTEATVHFNAELRYTGDADGDGSITSTDARLALQLSVSKIAETDIVNPDGIDVDHDGKITSTDARMILQYSVGKIKDWP